MAPLTSAPVENQSSAPTKDEVLKLNSLPASKFLPTSFPLPENGTLVTIGSDNQLFPIITSYIVANRSSGTHSSLTYKACKSAKENVATHSSGCGDGLGDLSRATEGGGLAVTASLGLGVHRFKDDQTGGEFIAIMQDIGDPVGTGCGAKVLRNLVLCAPNSSPECDELALRRLVSRCWGNSQAEKKGYFKIFRFDANYECWDKESEVKARSLDSVILPTTMKDKLLNDLDDFLSPDTQDYYITHGIPYKRSYLLHGVPGGGKTSLIQAIAGAYARNLAFLQPTHPDMTDDALRAAMQRVPKNALVVMEDIDALFAKDRSAKNKDSKLTFSGLLNALDGVGSADGQMIFITTNFREQLDSALIRNGRIDVHIHFDKTNEEQCRVYFDRFYPSSGSDDDKEKKGDTQKGGCDKKCLATKFGRAVMEALEEEELEISTAVLQHFFVTHRNCTAEEALAAVGDIVQEIKLRKEEEMAKDDAREESKDDGKANLVTAVGIGSALAVFLLGMTSRRVK